MPQTYAIHKNQHHFGWNNTLPPVLKIAPGDIVEFDMLDAGGGQIKPDSTVDILSSYDSSRVNPAFGPVFVDGAEPGDALKVTFLSFSLYNWAWTANIPGFGLLADQFHDPALHIWHFNPDDTVVEFSPGGRIPLKPFPGIVGVAPAEAGIHDAIVPLATGGNLDTRDLAEGTELYLPVAVPGALFSMGDGHAAQGDGEICGTAMECPMKVTVRIELQKGRQLKYPHFSTPGPVTRHLDAKGYEVATGVGPNLMASARDAVSQMVQFIADRYRMRPIDAYMLCSVCGDLRISEIVDDPHRVVSFYFPKVVMEG